MNQDTDFDTVVIPAQSEGFEKVFIGENRWYQIRMNSSALKQIKYIAAYQVTPISAITHIAKVKSIEPWGQKGKWVLNFSEPAIEITHVILKKNGKIRAPQSPRYAVRERILKAKNLDDIWP